MQYIKKNLIQKDRLIPSGQFEYNCLVAISPKSFRSVVLEKFLLIEEVYCCDPLSNGHVSKPASSIYNTGDTIRSLVISSMNRYGDVILSG